MIFAYFIYNIAVEAYAAVVVVDILLISSILAIINLDILKKNKHIDKTIKE